MKVSHTDIVSSASGPRTVLMRPGVGATGHIVQRSDLLSRRLVVSHASLILVEEGRKRIRWSAGECVAHAGEAISLQAGQVVDIANTPGPGGAYRALWIAWQPELLDIGPGTAGPGVMRHAPIEDGFRRSFHRAIGSLSEAEAHPASIASHQLREVLLWLGERGFRFTVPAAVSPGMHVRRLLSADPSADWSMDRVAKETATSIPTLRRRLGAEGVVFRELVQDVRMLHALSLLQNTDTPIVQIALAVGYASASRFTSRFRTRFGYLPTDVRGQRRGRRA